MDCLYQTFNHQPATEIERSDEPWRRNFRVATGVVGAGDERALLALRQVAPGCGCEVAVSGQLVQVTIPSVSTEEVASRLLALAWDAFGRVTPVPCGDEGGAEARLAGRDTLGSLVLSLVDHPGKRIQLCRNCGRSFLTGSTRARYCSPSCRTAGFRQRT